MPLVPSPIAYADVRTAIVEAISLGTGLPQSSIVRAEPNEPNAPRPARPFATFNVRTAATRHGPAAWVRSPADGPTMWRLRGERQLGLELNFFATSQEGAYGLGMAMQLGLEMDAVKSALAGPNIAVWRIGDVTDISALLGTGYEGRAMLEVWFGIGIDVLTDLGAIAEANVLGSVFGDAGLIETIDVNAHLLEES